MPIFLAALLGGLASAAGSIAGRVLLALGIGYVTFSGLHVLIFWIKEEIFRSLLSISPQVLGIIGVLQVDTAINIIFSAIAVRQIMIGIVGGAITRMIIK